METLNNIQQFAHFHTLILIAGTALRLLIGMRKFNRRGLGGLQHFSNYFIGLITLMVELMLNCIAYALMVWGLLGLLLG